MTAVDYGPKPGGPTHPTPTGPDRNPDPPPPQPSGEPKNSNGPRPDTTRPVPTPRPAPGPGRSVAARQLDDIDANLVGLLALAYFGPAEQGTATSVDQVCAAEVLLFRLRQARRAVRELAQAYGFDLPVRCPAVSPVVGLGSTPARQVSSVDLPPPGGPVVPPSGSEGGRAGDDAVLAPGAVGDSRLVSDGPSAPGTAAHGGPATMSPGADFSLPHRPRFSMRRDGERLYGQGPL